MDPRGDLLVCGNLNVDMIYSVPKLPGPGESTPISKEEMVYGGCGGNISLGASRLGVSVRLSSVVGRDFDTGYKGRLSENGVDLSGLVIDPYLPSPKCIIMSTPEGIQNYAFMMGAMEKQRDLKIPKTHGVVFCHIATSDPYFSHRCAEIMKNNGIPASLDPGQEIHFRWGSEELERTLGNCSRFFGNAIEWEKLGEIMGWGGDEVEVGGRTLKQYPEAYDLIDEAVITLSEDGSALMKKEVIHHAPVKAVGRMVDATGAGDAFRGGFYAALARGYRSSEALLFGNEMGAHVLSVNGPQEYSISWDELEKRVDPAQLAHQSSRIS